MRKVVEGILIVAMLIGMAGVEDMYGNFQWPAIGMALICAALLVLIESKKESSYS